MVIIALSEVMVQYFIYDDGPNILGDAYWDDLFDHYLQNFCLFQSYVIICESRVSEKYW